MTDGGSSIGHAGRRLRRALGRRCPACGATGLFSSWFRIRHACASCRILTDRGEHDYFLGAILVNFIVAELIVAFAALIALAVTLPAPPWRLILYGSLLLAVVLPIIGYPYSKTVWLAIDLSIRDPVREGDEFAFEDEPLG